MAVIQVREVRGAALAVMFGLPPTADFPQVPEGQSPQGPESREAQTANPCKSLRIGGIKSLGLLSAQTRPVLRVREVRKWRFFDFQEDALKWPE